MYKRQGQTTLFVTHDQEEALELADRVVVMRAGKVEQVGTPEEIYRTPASPYVFEFIGRANVLHGQVKNGRFCTAELSLDAGGVEEGPARLYVRPHDVRCV